MQITGRTKVRDDRFAKRTDPVDNSRTILCIVFDMHSLRTFNATCSTCGGPLAYTTNMWRLLMRTNVRVTTIHNTKRVVRCQPFCIRSLRRTHKRARSSCVAATNVIHSRAQKSLLGGELEKIVAPPPIQTYIHTHTHGKATETTHAHALCVVRRKIILFICDRFGCRCLKGATPSTVVSLLVDSAGVA